MGEGVDLRALVIDGAPFSFGTLVLFAGALVVAAERISTLGFRYSLDAMAFLDQVTKLVQGGNPDRARRLCALNGRSPVARVVDAGIAQLPRGERAVSFALEERLAEERTRVLTRVGWFRPFAVAISLWGAAGALWILSGAYGQAAAMQADSGAQVIARGVWLAAGNASLALAAAAVCVVFHLLIATYARRMAAFLELGAKKVQHLASGSDAPVARSEAPSPRSAIAGVATGES